MHDALTLEVVVQVGQVLRHVLVLALLFEDLAVAASDQDCRVILRERVERLGRVVEAQQVEVHHVVVDAVELVIYHVVCIVYIGLHLQIPVHQCFPRANFNIYLVPLLPLHLPICNKYLGRVIPPIPVLLLALVKCLRCHVVAAAVAVVVIKYAPILLRCLSDVSHAKFFVADALSELCVLFIAVLLDYVVDCGSLSSLNLVVIAEIGLLLHSCQLCLKRSLDRFLFILL